MSLRGPGAVALTLGFTSLRSHPVPSLRWGCENTIKYFFLASFSAPWCNLSDGCHLSDGYHLTHDYGSTVVPQRANERRYVYCTKSSFFTQNHGGTYIIRSVSLYAKPWGHATKVDNTVDMMQLSTALPPKSKLVTISTQPTYVDQISVWVRAVRDGVELGGVFPAECLLRSNRLHWTAISADNSN